MVRILIADPHPIVRWGITSLSGYHPDWEIVGVARDAEEALSGAREEQPDIIVLDTALAEVADLAPPHGQDQPDAGACILVHTARSDNDAITDAIVGGARGYVLKNEGVDCLEAGISSLARRLSYFSPSVADILFPLGDRKAFRLTARELEIARLIVEGWQNKAIAMRLGLSVKTIETHRGNAMRKAGTNRMADFVRFCIQQNLVAA